MRAARERPAHRTVPSPRPRPTRASPPAPCRRRGRKMLRGLCAAPPPPAEGEEESARRVLLLPLPRRGRCPKGGGGGLAARHRAHRFLERRAQLGETRAELRVAHPERTVPL